VQGVWCIVQGVWGRIKELRHRTSSSSWANFDLPRYPPSTSPIATALDAALTLACIICIVLSLMLCGNSRVASLRSHYPLLIPQSTYSSMGFQPETCRHAGAHACSQRTTPMKRELLLFIAYPLSPPPQKTGKPRAQHLHPSPPPHLS
jgi:hypothetical protein